MELKVQGQEATAKIFTNDPNIDANAYECIISFLNSPAAEGSKIRFMPDYHAGLGCVIGTTATVEDKVVPNIVGVDIGCGVLAYEIDRDIDFVKLDECIRNNIPYGRNVHNNEQPIYWSNIVDNRLTFLKKLKRITIRAGMDYDYAVKSIGTLGGGNHYLEIDKLANGNNLLVVHSGSRNFGLKVAVYWQKIADSVDKSGYNKKIKEIKSKYKGKEISEKIKELNARIKPKGYLDEAEKEGYIEDAYVASVYASINRETILHTILNRFNIEPIRRIESVHNYIDIDRMILRKGAISAYDGEEILIPLNMRDGIIIAVGKGNPDWNFSAPHGAGRRMSRNEAKNVLNIDDFEDSMKGIYTTCLNKSTLDEAPMAYKDAYDILAVINETCTVTEQALPVYNFKAY